MALRDKALDCLARRAGAGAAWALHVTWRRFTRSGELAAWAGRNNELGNTELIRSAEKILAWRQARLRCEVIDENAGDFARVKISTSRVPARKRIPSCGIPQPLKSSILLQS
jgi:hypothetical protein